MNEDHWKCGHCNGTGTVGDKQALKTHILDSVGRDAFKKEPVYGCPHCSQIGTAYMIELHIKQGQVQGTHPDEIEPELFAYNVTVPVTVFEPAQKGESGGH